MAPFRQRSERRILTDLDTRGVTIARYSRAQLEAYLVTVSLTMCAIPITCLYRCSSTSKSIFFAKQWSLIA